MKHNAKLVAALQLERSGGKSRQISQALRSQLIAEVRRAREGGASAVRVAAAYGLSVPTVYAWTRGPKAFLAVQVADTPAPPFECAQTMASALCVQDPRSGLVVFGCSIEQVAALMAACR
jgi:hypothetical protein